MMLPRMAVPSVPPTCMAVDCRPPATPASSTGALPTITSVAPTMTGLSPRPSRMNQRTVPLGSDAAPSRDRPNRATAARIMPVNRGRRGPSLVISRPETGEPMMSMPVMGSSHRPVFTGS
jgi:hypothetical protein